VPQGVSQSEVHSHTESQGPDMQRLRDDKRTQSGGSSFCSSNQSPALSPLLGVPVRPFLASSVPRALGLLHRLSAVQSYEKLRCTQQPSTSLTRPIGSDGESARRTATLSWTPPPVANFNKANVPFSQRQVLVLGNGEISSRELDGNVKETDSR